MFCEGEDWEVYYGYLNSEKQRFEREKNLFISADWWAKRYGSSIDRISGEARKMRGVQA